MKSKEPSGENVSEANILVFLKRTVSIKIIRDIYSVDDGYLYDGEDKRGLGFAFVLQPTSALCKTPEEREQLKLTMERKKRAFNNTKSFLKDLKEISMEEICENYKTAYKNEELEMRIKNAPKSVTKILRTRMNEVVRITREQEKAKKLKTEFFAIMAEELDNVKKDEN